MPRKARIDVPGALHHIIIRGIEKRRIFEDDKDRDEFIKRLGDVISEAATPIYAWALMPNHVHLLLKSGLTPIATIKRRLLTGYAVYYNRRYRPVIYFKTVTNRFCARSSHIFKSWSVTFI